MKKILLLFASVVLLSSQINAQFGCGSAVPITNGYTAAGITTPGTAGIEDWNVNPTGTTVSASYWDDDVYLFEYTAGATAEAISMTIFSRSGWNGIGIFDDCTGTTFSNVLDDDGLSAANVSKTVTANIAAGNTVYIAVGQWGTPDNLDFDVTAFTVTPITCPEPTLLSTSNITATSADLAWTTGGASNWNIEIGLAGFVQGTGLVVPVSTNPFSALGLTANTSYDWYVQDSCGVADLSNWAGPNSFTTPCATITPDYTEDFSAFVPSCWTEADAGSLATGPNTLGFGSWAGSTALTSSTARLNLYTTDRSEWMLSPLFDLTAGGYEVVIDVAVTDYFGTTPDVMGSDDEVTLAYTEDGITWTAITSWTAADALSNTLTTFSFPLVSTSANVQFGILGVDGPVDDAEDYDFHFTNFIVRTPPSCPAPTALSASVVSSTEADLLWTTGGATVWVVEYGPIGFAQGTGTVVPVTGADSLNLTGLSANTDYDWYVSDFCNPDTSAWVGPNSFYTGYCTPAPTSVDGSGITNVTFGTPTVVNNTTVAEAGNYGDYSALVGDGAQGSVTNVDITFETGYIYGTQIWIDWNNDLDFDDAGELVYTGLSTNANPTTLNASFTVPLATPLGNYTMRIGGRYNTSPGDPCYSGSWGTFEDYTLNVLPAPPCVAPAALMSMNVTSTSAELSWTTGGSTDWIVEYGAPGFAPGTGAGTEVNVSTLDSLFLTGLTPSTPYDWYVRDNCGSDTSAFSPMANFVTLCPAVFTAPFCEGFEGNVCGVNETADQLDWTLNSGGTTSSNTGPSAANSGTFYAYVETSGSTAGDTAIFYSPTVDLTALTTPALDFYYHMYGAGMNPDGTVTVDVSNDGLTWTNIFSQVGDQGNQWNNGYAEFPAFAGDTVVFRITGIVSPSTTGNTYENDFAIDDFCVIEALPCPGAPSDLSVSNLTYTSADLHWMSNFAATDFVVEYGVAGFTLGTVTPVSVSTDTFTSVSGLTANTNYEFYVRDFCGASDSSNWAGPFAFYTGYCVPGGSTLTDPMGITNVAMGSINNTTGIEAGSYGDYTALVADAGQGVSFDIDVTLETGYAYNVWAWVDWNNDLDFNDAGEEFYLGESTSAVPSLLSGSIMIPATASLGNHIIRIGSADGGLGSTSPSDPCYSGAYAALEDYTLNVIACSIPVTTIPTGLCTGDSLVLTNGTVVTAAGSYNDTLTVASGCDSVLTYNVTMLMPTTAAVSMSACQGSPLTLPGGTMVTASGTYVEVYTNAASCDSTVTYTVTVNIETSSITEVHLCDGATYTLPTGVVVSDANTYVINETNAAGCDSTANFVVTTGMSTMQTLNVSFCAGGSVTLADGTVATAAGTMMVASTNASGCVDSITYNITELPVSAGAMSASICDGGTYMFDGNVLTAAGTYTMVTPSSNGCDSTVTLTLSVNPTYNTAVAATICNGSSYSFGGSMLTASGVYTSTLSSVSACDSTVTLTLTVDPATNQTTSASICKGDVYTLGTQSLTDAGTYTETFTNSNGCTYTETLTLSVGNSVSTSEDVFLCGGVTSYTLANGTVVTSGGIYTATVAATNSCDSTITYNVSECVGIFDVENNVAMTVYPNPTVDVLNVLFSEKLSTQNSIVIVNVLGQTVYSAENISDLKLVINTSDFNSGMYYINVTSDNKTSVKSFTVAK